MPRGVALLACLALLAVTGCLGAAGDSPFAGGGPTTPTVGGAGFHVRETDFYHSYESLGESHTDVVTWQNPEGKARLEVRHSLTKGSERLVVQDASGKEIWIHEFWPGTRPGEYYPGAGEPGTWTITIERREAWGQFDVHIWRDVPPEPTE